MGTQGAPPAAPGYSGCWVPAAVPHAPSLRPTLIVVGRPCKRRRQLSRTKRAAVDRDGTGAASAHVVDKSDNAHVGQAAAARATDYDSYYDEVWQRADDDEPCADPDRMWYDHIRART